MVCFRSVETFFLGAVQPRTTFFNKPEPSTNVFPITTSWTGGGESTINQREMTRMDGMWKTDMETRYAEQTRKTPSKHVQPRYNLETRPE